MRVLIACESSGVVRRAFRALGADAWSCDLLPADDNDIHHIQADVSEMLGGWDLIIGHPPCTYLCSSGLHWETRDPTRAAKREEAAAFAMKIWNANARAIAIENPIGALSRYIGKPTQTIQPYEFGHDASKRTALWLKGLPPLRPTKFVEPRLPGAEQPDLFGLKPTKPRWGNQTDSGQNRLPPSADRWKLRSKTYEGIAQAMATQWMAALTNARLTA